MITHHFNGTEGRFSTPPFECELPPAALAEILSQRKSPREPGERRRSAALSPPNSLAQFVAWFAVILVLALSVWWVAESRKASPVVSPPLPVLRSGTLPEVVSVAVSPTPASTPAPLPVAPSASAEVSSGAPFSLGSAIPALRPNADGNADATAALAIPEMRPVPRATRVFTPGRLTPVYIGDRLISARFLGTKDTFSQLPISSQNDMWRVREGNNSLWVWTLPKGFSHEAWVDP
jgi:hypothetical protein